MNYITRDLDTSKKKKKKSPKVHSRVCWLLRNLKLISKSMVKWKRNNTQLTLEQCGG